MKASIFGYPAPYDREKQFSNLTQAFLHAPAGADITGHMADALRYGVTETPGWWTQKKRSPVFWEKYLLCHNT